MLFQKIEYRGTFSKACFFTMWEGFSERAARTIAESRKPRVVTQNGEAIGGDGCT
jgi:hypothetical protein